MNPCIVTGYIPIPNHPRSAAEYGKLGEGLFPTLAFDGPVIPFYSTLRDCWADKVLRLRAAAGRPFAHAVADNPAKNSLAYHVVNHQKFHWLLRASQMDKKLDPLIWIDYGIASVPGVTPAVVDDFLVRVQSNDFAIPGCWGEGPIDDSRPCWRFCGGLMVVPRKDVLPLFLKIRRTFCQRLDKTNLVTWEVNSLAHAEPLLPNLRWYEADHNETLFTNYRKGLLHESTSGVSVCPLDSKTSLNGPVPRVRDTAH